MIRHLSHDEISAVVAGETSPEATAHLRECIPCRREVEHFQDVLGHFRGAVRDLSDTHFRPRPAVQPHFRAWPAAAYACTVALAVLLSVVGYQFSKQPERRAEPSPVVLESDTLLLKQVKADVSRSTPPGMETLLGFSTTGTAQR